ncbi:MAG TPA: hypothetical protein VGL99_24515, partial [Chloroflexota bacterium]
MPPYSDRSPTVPSSESPSPPSTRSSSSNHRPLSVGDTIEFIVGYSDTTTMLEDELYARRNNRVEAIWPILG